MSGMYLECYTMQSFLPCAAIAPYVVGSNPNSPANPYSAIASGGNDIKHIDTSPEQEAYVIYGAVLAGPDKNDSFYDIRSDWVETKVRLSFNLNLILVTPLLNIIRCAIGYARLQRTDAHTCGDACPERHLRSVLHAPPAGAICC